MDPNLVAPAPYPPSSEQHVEEGEGRGGRVDVHHDVELTAVRRLAETVADQTDQVVLGLIRGLPQPRRSGETISVSAGTV
jgi:hypothetical protein